MLVAQGFLAPGARFRGLSTTLFRRVISQFPVNHMRDVVIQIIVKDNDTYHINGQSYLTLQSEKIKQAIDAIANGQDYRIQLYILQDTQKEILNNYLDPMSKICIKQLSIVETDVRK